MSRILGIFLVALMIGTAILTYDTKHRAELAGDKVTALRADIAKERSTIAMLRAEWSVLTQPARLQMLTERFKSALGLVNVDVAQIVNIDEVPVKPVALAPALDHKPVGSTVRATR